MADFAGFPISYDVDLDQCPAQAAFVRELERKGASREELASAGELRIVIKESDGGWLGNVTQGELNRAVKGASCEEVAMVLAFAVAIVRTKPETLPIPTKPAIADPDPGPPPAVGFERVWSFGAGIGAATSIAPDVVPYLRLELGVVWHRKNLARMLFVAPVVTFGGDRAASTGVATFRLVGAAVGACPWGLFAERFALFPCAEGQFGARLASGLFYLERPWVALGPSLRASARVGDAVWLDLNGFAGVNANQDTFFVRHELVHQTELLGFSVGAQLRWTPR